MKAFNHLEIARSLNTEFGLTSYFQGNFIHFKKNDCEIGYIEKIPATKKTFFTIYSSFFDFENLPINEQITKKIQKLYIEQKSLFKKQKNIVLANSNGVKQEFLFN